MAGTETIWELHTLSVIYTLDCSQWVQKYAKQVIKNLYLDAEVAQVLPPQDLPPQVLPPQVLPRQDLHMWKSAVLYYSSEYARYHLHIQLNLVPYR